MARRIYFYRDDKGDIQKYSYCCICSAGPFKQSEKDISFISTGSKSDICYCEKCHKNLGIKNLGKPLDESSLWKRPSQVVDFKKPVIQEKVAAPEIPEEPIVNEDPELPDEVQIHSDGSAVLNASDIPEEIYSEPDIIDDPELPDESSIIDDPISEEPAVLDEPVIPGENQIIPEETEEIQAISEGIKEPEVSDEMSPEVNEPVIITKTDEVQIFTKDSNVIVNSVVTPEPEASDVEIPSDSVIIEEPEINAVDPSLINEPVIPRDVFKEETKSRIKIEPNIYVYIGQYTDGAFKVDLTRNVQSEIKKINQGIYPDIVNLPIELIYYKKFKDWKRALSEKDRIQQMNKDQKEELSKNFIKILFKNLNI